MERESAPLAQNGNNDGPIRPWQIALSIAIGAGAVLLLFQLDLRQHMGPFEIDRDISLAQYEDLFRRHAFEYSIWTLEQARSNFQWSLRSSQYIFWVSMLISVSGVCFAFWQFAVANQFDRAGAERDEVEVKTELASLSFKTRSVATLVLLISIVYLMIYVGFLYGVDVVEGPLKERPSIKPPTVATPAGDETGNIADPRIAPDGAPIVEDVESDDTPLDLELPPDAITSPDPAAETGPDTCPNTCPDIGEEKETVR